jgi:hypothetical protein
MFFKCKVLKKTFTEAMLVRIFRTALVAQKVFFGLFYDSAFLDWSRGQRTAKKDKDRPSAACQGTQ